MSNDLKFVELTADVKKYFFCRIIMTNLFVVHAYLQANNEQDKVALIMFYSMYAEAKQT